MSGRGKFLDEIVHLDRSAFSVATGIRATTFAMTPLVVGLATGQIGLLFSTLGAMFLTNTEGSRAAPLPLRLLLAACFTEAIAFGLGTLAGTAGALVVPLLGIGVFLALMIGVYPRLAQAGMITAIIFAVGVGLPGGSTATAVERLLLSLLGGFWALAGIGLQRWLTPRRPSAMVAGTVAPVSETHQGSNPPPPDRPRLGLRTLRSEAFRHALAVGIASALGFAIALILGLPRDFWVVVTIIITVRSDFGSTFSVTLMMVIGTVVGAVIAAAITLEISDLYLLAGLLFGFYVLMFATRGVNVVLMQALLTPAIIILLNILYPGHWQLAGLRILDVTFGGGVAVLTVYLLGIGSTTTRGFGKGSVKTKPPR